MHKLGRKQKKKKKENHKKRLVLVQHLTTGYEQEQLLQGLPAACMCTAGASEDGAWFGRVERSCQIDLAPTSAVGMLLSP